MNTAWNDDVCNLEKLMLFGEDHFSYYRTRLFMWLESVFFFFLFWVFCWSWKRGLISRQIEGCIAILKKVGRFLPGKSKEGTKFIFFYLFLGICSSQVRSVFFKWLLGQTYQFLTLWVGLIDWLENVNKGHAHWISGLHKMTPPI